MQRSRAGLPTAGILSLSRAAARADRTRAGPHLGLHARRLTGGLTDGLGGPFRLRRDPRRTYTVPNPLPAFLVSQRACYSSSTAGATDAKKKDAHALAIPPDVASQSRLNLAHIVGSRLGLPTFHANTAQLETLCTPNEFLRYLLRMIARAQSTIYLASLYIGPSEKELLDALRQALHARPHLRLVVLVDYLRGTREVPPRASGASVLAELVQQFPAQVVVRMWRTPRYDRTVFSVLGKRLNEGAGLQHIKLYACDDTVLISGANLSTDYFTNRQDRYLVIHDHAEFGNYARGLLDRIASFAFALAPSERRPQLCDGDIATQKAQTNQQVVQSGRRGAQEEQEQTRHSTPTGQTYSLTWPADVPTQSHIWAREARATLEKFTRSTREAQLLPGPAERVEQEEGVTFTPLLQMGPFGIEQETAAVEIALKWLQSQDGAVSALQHLDDNAKLRSAKEDGDPIRVVAVQAARRPCLYLTSGYFSVYPSLASAVIRGTYPTEIIAAAPKANGFFGSKGVSGFLPDGYTLLAYKFWQRLARAGRAVPSKCFDSDNSVDPIRISSGKANVVLNEWEKDGWTYHAKGTIHFLLLYFSMPHYPSGCLPT